MLWKRIEMGARSQPRNSFFFLIFLIIISLIFITKTTSANGAEQRALPSVFFTREPPNRVEFSNNTGAKIECAVGGGGNPEIRWLNEDGVALDEVRGVRRGQADGTLVFSPFGAEAFRQDVHTAVYRCKATSGELSILSRNVQVKAVMDVDYEANIYDVFAIRGNIAVIKCHVPTFLADYVSVVAFIKDGTLKIGPKTSADSKYSLFPNGVLYVHNVSHSDIGSSFRCQTLHRLTSHSKVSAGSGKLFVTEPHGNISPKIIDSQTIINAEVGQDVLMPCVPHSHPPPSVRWLIKNGGRLLELSSREGKYRVLSHGMLIRNVQLVDAGLYVCHINSSYGEDETETTLTVRAPLKPSVDRATQRANWGSPAAIRCHVTGFPVRSVNWTRNAVQLQSSKSLDDLQIVIDAVHLDDVGLYQCFVKNEFESAQATAEIQIGAFHPMLKSAFNESVVEPGSPVALSCSALGNPTPRIRWSLDTLPILADNYRMFIHEKMFHNLFTSTLQMKMMTEAEGGVYGCEAENEEGTQLHARRIAVYGALKARKIPPLKVIAGQQAHLNCPLQGYPIDHIRWIKENLQLPMNIRQDLFTTNWTLVINDVNRAQDSGVYTCVATSKKNKQNVTSEINLSVLVLPKIAPFAFQEDVLREGIRAQIQCVVSEGDTPLDLKWKKEEELISKGEGDISISQLDEHSSILTIKHVAPKHNGRYTCVATNPAGTTTYSTLLSVNVAPRIVPFNFQGEHLFEGVLARVSCVVYQGDLPIHIRWSKNGQFLDHAHLKGVQVQTVDNFTSILTINHVTSEHSGDYTCVAKNMAASASHMANLLVKVPPKWKKVPDVTVSALSGTSVYLDCEAEGNPPPTISWLTKQGSSGGAVMRGLAEVDGRFQVFPNGTLFVSHVSPSLEDAYFCKASNGIGQGLSWKVQLHVRVPVQIVDKSPKQSIRVGQRVALFCVIQGHQPFNTSWTVDNKTLLNGDKSKYLTKLESNSTHTTMSLSIPKATNSDAKHYSCNVKDAYGQDNDFIEIVVKGPPDVPRRLNATNRGNKSVEVMWETPFDGHSPILRYWVQYKLKREGLVVNASTSDGHTNSIVLRDLHPSSLYQIAVAAENAVGLGDKTPFIYVTLHGEAPSAPPTNIQVLAQNGRSLRVSWQPPPSTTWNGAILGYHVGYRESEGTNLTYESRLLEVPEGYDKGLSFTLSELKEFTSYAVVLQAFNVHGKGPLSPEVLAMTSEGVPTHPPLAVDCLMSSSTSLTVRWEAPPHAFHRGIIRGYRVHYWTPDYFWNGESVLSSANVSGETSVAVRGLLANANYSIQVLAFTMAGDGASSKPIFCHTLEDVPAAPRNVKALPLSSDSVLVLWTPPAVTNGRLVQYTVYYEDLQSNKEIRVTVKSGDTLKHKINNLKTGHKYNFRVSASTVVGEGPSTHQVTASPTSKPKSVSISAFGELILARVDHLLILQCPVVGGGLNPRYQWLFNNEPVMKEMSDKVLIQSDGSLRIPSVTKADKGNYTCQVSTNQGQDKITHNVIVKVPPSTPNLVFSGSTETSITVQWKLSTDVSNTPILGYALHYKRELEFWLTFDLQPYMRTYELANLQCGSTYQLYLTARNEIGESTPSQTISATTKGGVPVVPAMEQLVEASNAHATLNLSSWVANGCPILFFAVEYKPKDRTNWILASNDLSPSKSSLRLYDLQPSTWYTLRIAAHTSAGTAVAEYDFSTLDISEDTFRDDDGRFSADDFFQLTGFNLIVSISSCSVVVLLCLSITCFWVKRRNYNRKKQQKKQAKAKVKSGSGGQGKHHHRHHQQQQQGRKKKKGHPDDDISPYAMVKLSDIHPPGSKVKPSDHRVAPMSREGTPLRQASMHNYNPTAPPMSENYFPRGGGGSGDHSRKYPLLPTNPMYAMPHKEKSRHVRNSSQHNIGGITSMPLPPIPTQQSDIATIFDFPPPPILTQEDDYDPPPPDISW